MGRKMIYRYRKDGEMDIFTYVQWKDEDAQGYEKTVFAPQTKPLSDEEIIKIFNKIWVAGGNTNGVMHRFARAIEERHGIK